MNNIPKYKCTFCGKLYVKPQTLQKHVIICQFIVTNKEYVKDHDIEPVVSTGQMYELLKVLINKTTAMEAEIKHLKKLVKTKPRIDIYQWLSSSVVPEFAFEEFTENICVLETHINYLKNNSICETINTILEESINSYDNPKYCIPIYCSTERSKLIYIYNRTSTWVEFDTATLTSLLNSIHKKILIALCAWRTKYEAITLERDIVNFNEDHNERVLKLMCCDFKNSRTLAKIKNELFKKVKEKILNSEV